MSKNRLPDVEALTSSITSRFLYRRKYASLLYGGATLLALIFFLRFYGRSSSQDYIAAASRRITDADAFVPTDNPAFLSFLASDYHTEPNTTDWYFTSLRVLTYQILHAPGTKSRFPFLIGVTKDVNPEKRAQLQDDGAIIVDLPHVSVIGQSGRAQFKDQMEKLSFFNLYGTYGRFCYVDADVLLLESLDGIFQDQATQIQITRAYGEEIKADEPPLPSTYLFAGHAEGTGHHADKRKRTQNAKSPDYVNAGFIVFAPGREIFEYYSWVANHTDRWDTMWAEQNLYNYVHRRPGNMPWTRLNDDWNAFRASDMDIKRGTKSAHGHLWDEEYGKRYGRLGNGIWNRTFDEMTWFYGNRTTHLP